MIHRGLVPSPGVMGEKACKGARRAAEGRSRTLEKGRKRKGWMKGLREGWRKGWRKGRVEERMEERVDPSRRRGSRRSKVAG